jgi:hypothetical protein
MKNVLEEIFKAAQGAERRRLHAYFLLKSSRIEQDDQIALHSIVAF